MAKFEIRRQNQGRTPTKWGIVTKNMPPKYKKVLTENPIIRFYSDDDRFLSIIFRLEDRIISKSHSKRPFIDVESKEVKPYEEVKDSYLIFDWHCAYCKKPIKSRIDQITPQNFTCEKCFNYYIKDSSKISQRIIDSSFAFTENCKSKMIDNQKSFIKYIRKNDK